MEINRENYEVFFVDYLEGKLSPGEVAELLLFLEQHPDLKSELDLFASAEAVLPASDFVLYEGKENLKRPDLNHLLIAELEGDLTANEEAQLRSDLFPVSLVASERKLFAYTRLIPENILYPDKPELKRKGGRLIPFYYYATSIAAGLLLLAGIYTLFNDKSTENAITAEVKNTLPVAISVPENTHTKSLALNPVNNKAEKKHSYSRVGYSPAHVHPKTVPVANTNTKVDGPEIKEYTNAGQTGTELATVETKKQDDTFTYVGGPLTLLALQAEESKSASETPEQFILRKLKGDEKPMDRKPRWVDLAEASARMINKVTGKRAEVKEVKTDCKTTYQFALGGLEFERSIACR